MNIHTSLPLKILSDVCGLINHNLKLVYIYIYIAKNNENKNNMRNNKSKRKNIFHCPTNQVGIQLKQCHDSGLKIEFCACFVNSRQTPIKYTNNTAYGSRY